MKKLLAKLTGVYVPMELLPQLHLIAKALVEMDTKVAELLEQDGHDSFKARDHARKFQALVEHIEDYVY